MICLCRDVSSWYLGVLLIIRLSYRFEKEDDMNRHVCHIT